MRNLVIGGKGNVGSEYVRLAQKAGIETVLSRCREANNPLFVEEVRSADIVTIAIPPISRGSISLGFALRSLESGKAVVTAEKAMCAYHWEHIRPYYKRNLLAITATVGGGSKPLDKLDGHAKDPITEIVAIQNATTNFFCWFMQNHPELEDVETKALEEALRLKYPEPGATSVGNAAQCEVGLDSRAKAAITFNRAELDGIVSPDDFNVMIMANDYLIQNMKKLGVRFVMKISLNKHDRFREHLFWYRQGPWTITGAFANDAQTIFPNMDISSENNAMLVRRASGKIETANGKGAGPEPTATAMLDDAKRLLGIT